MARFNKIYVFTFLIFSFVATNFAQTDNVDPLGWDLSYQKPMEKNQGNSVVRLKEWLYRNRRSAVKRIIGEFKDEPIISAVLIERPTLSDTKKTTMLFVKTKKNAYFWENTELDNSPRQKISFSVKIYDRMFKKFNSWRQAIPISSKENLSGWEGYFAVLSTYKKGKARQVLLTFEDFFVFSDTGKQTINPGRLSQAVDVVTETIPALSASLFGNCRSRPSKKELIQILGDPVSCYSKDSVCFNELQETIECPRESEKTLCFKEAALSYTVKFNDFDLPESILIGSVLPHSERAAARLIPDYSWIQYWARRYKKRAGLPPTEEIQIYQDDCLEIRNKIPKGQTTAMINGTTKITWKK